MMKILINDESQNLEHDFHNRLISLGFFENSAQLQHLMELALVGAARQMAFIAEIEACKWVYKGESFAAIAHLEHKAYSEKYLRMIALF